jgi:UDP-GlcNAc3NAcA epimerase
MKTATIVGARPQFIKAAVVYKALRAYEGISDVFIHTGQHFDSNMCDIFLEELHLPVPTRHLGIHSGSHGDQTGRMLVAVERVLADLKPDLVLVYGDTNSTLAGALGAAKLHIPVAHVEAGLRSFNRRMPEEINRIVADHISDILFAPTEAAVENLRAEGLARRQVHLVGDVMYDAAVAFAAVAESHSDVLTRMGLPRSYCLATIHRAENTDDPSRLYAIFEGLGALSESIPVVVPLHPRTRSGLKRLGKLDEVRARMTIIDPVGFLDMIMLETRARIIATDSGGVQKEAYFYRVPCVTLREETEWVELVHHGWNTLCPPRSAERIRAAIEERIDSRGEDVSLYGRGQAAQRIAEVIAGEGKFIP